MMDMREKMLLNIGKYFYQRWPSSKNIWRLYEGEDMKRIAPMLNLGEKERILVVHDECIFYSNDGNRGTWAKSGELPLRKKGNGKSIMVSEFLTEACGRLKLTAEHIENYPDVPEEARV